MDGPGRERQPLGGAAEHGAGLGRGTQGGVERTQRDLRVGGEAACALAMPGACHAGAHVGAGLARRRRLELGEAYGGKAQVQVDAVEERPGEAAVAAGQQGKFWEMHDKIFANQSDLSPATYEGYATELGLDIEQFKRDMASEASQKQIEADKQEAAKLGVTGTPSFFVNGYFLSGAQPYESFKVIIDRQLAEEA